MLTNNHSYNTPLSLGSDTLRNLGTLPSGCPMYNDIIYTAFYLILFEYG